MSANPSRVFSLQAHLKVVGLAGPLVGSVTFPVAMIAMGQLKLGVRRMIDLQEEDILAHSSDVGVREDALMIL